MVGRGKGEGKQTKSKPGEAACTAPRQAPSAVRVDGAAPELIQHIPVLVTVVDPGSEVVHGVGLQMVAWSVSGVRVWVFESGWVPWYFPVGIVENQQKVPQRHDHSR